MLYCAQYFRRQTRRDGRNASHGVFFVFTSKKGFINTIMSIHETTDIESLSRRFPEDVLDVTAVDTPTVTSEVTVIDAEVIPLEQPYFDPAQVTDSESSEEDGGLAQVLRFPELNSGIEYAKNRSVFSRFRGGLLKLLNRPDVRTRAATEQDIEEIVDVDVRAFSSVYADYDVDPSIWRKELVDKFEGRYEKLGGKWLRIFERDGKIAGFINSCPTSKTPEDFVNWEDTTDDGTLETTYDPNGDYLYVVSLSMVPEGSKLKGQNMLFGDQIGQFVTGQFKQAFFESRMPGFRKWVDERTAETSLSADELSSELRDELAQEYFALTKEVNGKTVPHDRLLSIYKAVGCRLLKVVPDAYQDAPSMNYGVVCVFDNPLPETLRRSKLASTIAGQCIRAVSKSLTISKKLF